MGARERRKIHRVKFENSFPRFQPSPYIKAEKLLPQKQSTCTQHRPTVWWLLLIYSSSLEIHPNSNSPTSHTIKEVLLIWHDRKRCICSGVVLANKLSPVRWNSRLQVLWVCGWSNRECVWFHGTSRLCIYIFRKMTQAATQLVSGRCPVRISAGTRPSWRGFQCSS